MTGCGRAGPAGCPARGPGPRSARDSRPPGVPRRRSEARSVTSAKSFGSDNHAGAHEAVLRAMAAANPGDTHGYGEDPWTERVTREMRGPIGGGGGGGGG